LTFALQDGLPCQRRTRTVRESHACTLAMQRAMRMHGSMQAISTVTPDFDPCHALLPPASVAKVPLLRA
jgi:hypothetical protein